MSLETFDRCLAAIQAEPEMGGFRDCNFVAEKYHHMIWLERRESRIWADGRGLGDVEYWTLSDAIYAAEGWKPE